MTRAALVPAALALPALPALTALWALACSSAPFSYDASGGNDGSGGAGVTASPEPASGGAPDTPGKRMPVAGSSQAGSVSSGEGGAAGDSSEPGMAGESGTTGQAGSGTSSSGVCPALGGEKLVLASGFCIDETEVTAAHYQAFVDQHPSVSEQPYACQGNLSFASGCSAPQPEKQPVRCVDWCDARAYCASVGKKLCGSSASSAASSGAMPYDAPANALENQWYSACSHGGEVAYPYGDDYDAAACWGADRPQVGVATVKSAQACVGGYAGLWDMSGGVAEWVDSCNGEKGMTDACHIRGGSSSGSSEQLRCDWQSATPRDTSSSFIGFRCCADLVK